MEEFKIDALAITETWLKDNKEDDQWAKTCEFNTYGYQIQTIHRINKRGGGVALVTKDEASIASLDTNNCTNFEHKTWNIQFKSQLTYTVTGIYHSPSNCQANDNNSTFRNQFTNLLTLLSSKSKNIICKCRFLILFIYMNQCVFSLTRLFLLRETSFWQVTPGFIRS